MAWKYWKAEWEWAATLGKERQGGMVWKILENEMVVDEPGVY